MYLSQLIVRNYRSIKQLNINFEKGKNIIVGKNNAGKSNIIKAIDLILGDTSPTYEKLENITDNDFFGGDTSKNILIFAKLNREAKEPLNYEELYKCYGFYRDTNQVNLPENNPDIFSRHLAVLFKTNPEDLERARKKYINPKLKNQRTFENEFDNKHEFGLVFYAHKDDHGRINKEMRFIYREGSGQNWVVAFSAAARNGLLQSAIIPSFRDPQNQLRISSWSWYGKLLKSVVDPNNKNLQKAFQEVKIASEDVFSQLETKINNSKVKVAFPNTKISFQFNPDTKQDIHKSALVYVDDGFKSQLQDKGSGIQSAVIIGLFDFYTREIAHQGNSLLAVEEPELYLHPHGRRVLSNRLDDFLDGNKNQVIITTHSPEFISTANDRFNIVVACKNEEGKTEAKNVNFSNAKERQILIKNQNAEMFFADCVILVEGGGDKYILEMVAKKFGEEKNIGSNWLNDNNISVIPVIGKSEFYKYAKKLKEANIDCYIFADFDYLCSKLAECLTELDYKELKNDHNTVNGKIKKIPNEKCEACKQNIKAQSYPKRIDELTDKALKTEVESFIAKLSDSKIYICADELEDRYRDKNLIKGISGKEEAALHIVGHILETNKDINDLIELKDFWNIFDKILEHKKIPPKTQNSSEKKVPTDLPNDLDSNLELESNENIF